MRQRCHYSGQRSRGMLVVQPFQAAVVESGRGQGQRVRSRTVKIQTEPEGGSMFAEVHSRC